MLRFSIAIAGLVTAAPLSAASQTPPLQSRIAQIQRFAAAEGGRLWPGYDRASFGLLLVDGKTDRLYCFARLPDGFTKAAKDPVTKCDVATRASGQFGDNLLAAMPAFGPPSVIVMGTPESTGRSDADWARTILHEHFHQWQDGLPDIFQRMAALDLSGGDQTGMWMLNFPFPYDQSATAAALKPAAAALLAALEARETPAFPNALERYATARRQLAAAVGERNWRYAELQLWKEGVARWTEIELGRRSDDPTV
ncbi:MAG TPA: hypothetical protein VNR68_01165, partial [Sphingomicrobium sp.]|nr:hypothetical protein [Sphingomicrobium sp.]